MTSLRLLRDAVTATAVVEICGTQYTPPCCPLPDGRSPPTPSRSRCWPPRCPARPARPRGNRRRRQRISGASRPGLPAAVFHGPDRTSSARQCQHLRDRATRYRRLHTRSAAAQHRRGRDRRSRRPPDLRPAGSRLPRPAPVDGRHPRARRRPGRAAAVGDHHRPQPLSGQRRQLLVDVCVFRRGHHCRQPQRCLVVARRLGGDHRDIPPHAGWLGAGFGAGAHPDSAATGPVAHRLPQHPGRRPAARRDGLRAGRTAHPRTAQRHPRSSWPGSRCLSGRPVC